VTHSFFGLQTVPIPPAAAEQAGLPEGLFVQAVTAGAPAATAGLRAEDVITKIDGEPATSNVQLQELTLTKNPVTRCRSATPGMASGQRRRSRWPRNRDLISHGQD
jgi:S1-C subfamily serine protease